MKRSLLSIVAIIGIAVFASCKKEPEEKPFPVGTWHTTRQYFNLTVNDTYPETIKEMREREETVAVPEAESYRLTFEEDGTGYGSGVHPDENERYDFHFTWQLSGSKLSIAATVPESGGIFYYNHSSIEDVILNEQFELEDIVWRNSMVSVRNVTWEIEESTADKMVLSTFINSRMEATESYFSIDETKTYRYTFEK